jgi:tetratricopeptide (TPR) repeat protein
MNALKTFTFLLPLIVLGCAGSTELHKGRAALLAGMPDTAAAHFREAAATNGTLKYSQLGEGVWTYLGRAYYDAKRYPEAQQSLERAVEANRGDGFARLYLGLTLARQGSYDTGRKEVLAGLQPLSEQLNFIVYNTESGHYWDPTGQLRGEIKSVQSAVTDTKPDLDKLFARLENLGIAIEQEMDAASKDQTIQLNRRFGDQ